MRFLMDADLPRRTAELLCERGYDAVDVRDIGLGGARDAAIAAHARQNGLCLVTGDFGFADVRNYPPEEYAGIVVLELPRKATTETILGVLRSLLDVPEVVARLHGRLAVVGRGHVRLRPAAEP